MSVASPTAEIRFTDKMLEGLPTEASSLITALQEVNSEFGYLPKDSILRVCETLGVPPARAYHVATFYSAFSLTPKGEHTIKVCTGTACHVRGAPRVTDELSRLLGVQPGETTADGKVSLETVGCLGACALGPVVVVNGRYYQASPEQIEPLLKSLDEAPVVDNTEAVAEGTGDDGPVDVTRLMETDVGVVVCGGTGCQAYGCTTVATALEAELVRHKIRDKVDYVQSGCHGFCDCGPIVVVRPENIFYQNVKPEDVARIVRETVIGGRVLEDLLYKNPADGTAIEREDDIPFYSGQQRVVLGDNGRISPREIDHYLERCSGYAALAKALKMEPDTIVDTITKSGLRGRGGGGFSTGRKWATCRKAKGEPHYVICNADEGDPGAYMDRSLLEGNPHRVIEGMLIGALAIGSHEGYVYVRDEYPQAVSNIIHAIGQAQERGYLGVNILGSGFDFDIKVVRGGGAFVCGESTALMASIEGRVGEPRAKYIHTVDSGLWEKPSNLNNVETWANVPLIIELGADWFASIGTSGSSGTKVFSLVGKVVNTGLVEVPMGITLQRLIYDIGGGIPEGKAFKAVQTGGPSGGCLPASMLDMKIEFDALTAAGSMMGSGGMIVMDETSCMVDVARYFLEFLQDESCGKCVPCREGITRMRDILDDICAGRGQPGDIDRLRALGTVTAEASVCALGGSSANPVLSTLKYFEEEYLAHIEHGKCPAKVCKALLTYRVLEDTCVGCTLCAKKCPENCISGERKSPHSIDQEKCIKCGACLTACKFDAVEVA
jgi:NADH-quinone oxidoreductase subunit F